MASGSQSMTTYYAKRIVGDASAAQANSALLQTGANVTADTWILNRTNRADIYGIKYVYDTTTTTVHNDENDEDITTNNGQDKIEFYGGSATASAWIQLNTGDTYISGRMAIGGINDSYKLYVNGSARIDSLLTLYREGSTANNNGTGIRFENKDTTTNQIQSAGKTYILAYNTHSADDNGMNMVIRPGGNLFIGGGESAEHLYGLNTTSTTENLYATADSTIYLEAGAQTIANRIGIAIDDDGTILPVKAEADNNNAQNIGTDATRWKTGYFSTSLLVGAANSATTYNSEASGSVITDGTISICRTTAGGGYYLYANGVQHGRLYVSGLGTANSGDGYATRGAQGYTSLWLGNSISRPAAGTEGGANNSRGRIYLYHTDETSTVIYSDSWNGHNLTVVGPTSDEANTTGDTWLILGNNKKKSAAEASTTGAIRIYGDEQYYHNIYSGSPTANRAHYLPNANGWIVTGGNGTSTGEGDNNTPVYLKTDGTLEAITSYDGNSATATALTSNAGGGEQPIYFTGGKPAATSYALKATVNNGTAAYLAYYSGARAISSWSAAKFHDGCLSLFPTTGSYREGIRIHSTGSWSDIILCGNDNTGDSGTSANSWFLGNNNGNFYISRNGSSSGTSWFGSVGNVWKLYGNQANSKSKQQSILHIYGPTCGNTAADMISGTAGLFSWGDGGPQITFDTSATPGGGQAGALIFTDNNTAATGASWHFVSNQGDWNVTSKRFHARTSISIGSDLPSTSYNLVVSGSTYHNGIVYFANGKTYYINNSGDSRLRYEHANTYTGYDSAGFILSPAGSPWPYIRFDTRAGGSTYVTTEQTNWCELYAQVPAKRDTTYYKTQFFFRQYSKTANTTTRLNYYEDYYLPETNDGRTGNAGYNILTTKDMSFSITGNASTATNADKVDNYHAADLWRKDGGTWNGNANIACTPTANNQEYSFDLGNAYTGTYWHVWSGKNSKSILICYNDNMNVSVPNGTLTAKAFSGPLTGNVTGNCSGSAGSVAWANVGSKPATATRWPTWSEIGDGADSLSEGTSAWTDNTEILTSYASNNGFADTNAKGKVYRRDAVCAYNYIKSKASGSWAISVTGSSASCTGNAATATALSNVVSNQSATNVQGALQAFWNAQKSTMPRDKLISFTSSHSGRAIHMGYFITGHDSNPYGGFFTAFYNTPYYSCSSNGTFSCYELVRNDSRTYSINVSGSAGSVTWANVSSKPATATRWPAWSEVTSKPSTFAPSSHDHTRVGAAASWFYFNNSNEVNFGGTYNGNAHIFFGYRATDSRPKPTDYYFGSGEGTANVHCNRLFAVSTTDAAGNAANAVALVVGGTQSQAHIEMDANEIIAKANGSSKASLWFQDNIEMTSDGKVKNAVWNDYAEYRQSDIITPGYCVSTHEDGIMHITNTRMQPNAHIVSDTFGQAIGMSDTAKTPIAVAGRVLVYPYQDRNNYHIGDCVCATYDGKVDIMTREEIKEFPDRIIGIVDEIPQYETWEQNYTYYKTNDKRKTQIKVNGRIWIYVR